MNAVGIRLAAALAALLGAGCVARPIDAGSTGAEGLEGDAALDVLEASAPLTAASQDEGLTRIRRALPTGDVRTSAVLLEKVVPDEVVLGNPFEYRIIVENLTDLDLTRVRVLDEVPLGLQIEGVEPQGSLEGGVARWELGTLAPGSQKTLVVRGIAQALGTITTSATVEYVSAVDASSRVVAPELQVVADAPARVIVGEPFELRVEVANVGTGTAREVRAVDVLPEGFSARDGQERFVIEFGDLGERQTKAESVEVVASIGGRFELEVGAEAKGGIEGSSESFTVVVAEPRLTLSVEAPDLAPAGTPIRIEFIVGNTGNGTSRATTIESVPSIGVELVSTSAEGDVVDGVVTWTLGDLEPGETARVAYSVWCEEARTFVTQATARAASAQPAVGTAQTAVE